VDELDEVVAEFLVEKPRNRSRSNRRVGRVPAGREGLIMSTSLTEAITYDNLVAITHDVWFAASGDDLSPDRTETYSRSYTGWVQITGPVAATVTVTCEAPLAVEIAAEMLGADDPATLTAADIHDAVGELANIVGGNVKALVPETARLSLPIVVPGEEANAVGADARRITTGPR
jgi:chemotaxis protein CheX